MRNTILERLKSWAVWVAVVAQILSILVLLEVITPTQSEQYNQIIGYILQLGVAFGVLNNPTEPDRF